MPVFITLITLMLIAAWSMRVGKKYQLATRKITKQLRLGNPNTSGNYKQVMYFVAAVVAMNLLVSFIILIQRDAVADTDQLFPALFIALLSSVLFPFLTAHTTFTLKKYLYDYRAAHKLAGDSSQASLVTSENTLRYHYLGWLTITLLITAGCILLNGYAATQQY